MSVTSTLSLAANTSAQYQNASQGTIQSAGGGILGGYEGDSLTWNVVIATFRSFTFYNAAELTVLIFVTFSRFHGLYFTSMLVATGGLIPYSLGFLLKFYRITQGKLDYLSLTLLTIGWWAMVTGQSVVLWSRIHLVLRDPKLLKWLLWMIIIDAIQLHIPTTVLTFGANANSNPSQAALIHAYSIMEKIQMTWFCIQEFILSGIYVEETVRILRKLLQEHTRKLLSQLLAINVMIIAMDCSLLGIKYANLYILETTLKGVIYSIHLKLEYAVLGRLVHSVNGPSNRGASLTTMDGGHHHHHEQNAPLESGNSSSSSNGHHEKLHRQWSVNNYNNNNNNHNNIKNGIGDSEDFGDISEFVDISRTRSHNTHAEDATLAAVVTKRHGSATSGIGGDRRVSGLDGDVASMLTLPSPLGSEERINELS